MFNSRVLRRYGRRQVNVTTKQSQVFRGVLFAVDVEWVELRNVEALSGESPGPVVVDGALLLQRADVAFVQFVG